MDQTRLVEWMERLITLPQGTPVGSVWMQVKRGNGPLIWHLVSESSLIRSLTHQNMSELVDW